MSANQLFENCCKGSEKNADKQILCGKREFIPYVWDGYGSCKGAE